MQPEADAAHGFHQCSKCCSPAPGTSPTGPTLLLRFATPGTASLSLFSSLRLTASTVYSAGGLAWVSAVVNPEGYAIAINFTYFNTNSRDVLAIYDGPSTLSPEIGSWYGTGSTAPPGPVTSTSST
jgi:hypothetical protein